MNKTIFNLLNDQMNMEFQAAYAYKAMEMYASANNYIGLAKWMNLQATEELDHFEKIKEFILSSGETPFLKSVTVPKADFSSFKDVLETSLLHEKKVTASIINLYESSTDEKDYFTQSFVRWFIDEQHEEEATVQGLIDRFELFPENQTYLFDKELFQRQ